MTSSATYSSHEFLRERLGVEGRRLGFAAKDLDEWRSWRQETVATLGEVIGLDRMVPAPLEPMVTEEEELEDHVRQRVEIQVEPGVVMPMYVLIPKGGEPPYSVALAPAGHASAGKYAVAGRRDITGLAETIDSHNYDYGLQMVRDGFIVFCPDPRGMGERQEKEARATGNIQAQSCEYLSRMGLPLGRTVLGMWTWDMMRLIDYVETRDDCRADRIGSGGLSGGGKQTLWAAALDERVKCAVVSGLMYGYKRILDEHCCPCNNVPRLFDYVDMGDVGALIAPRPLMVETGARDPLNGAEGLDNVYPQTEVIQMAYELHDAGGLFSHDVFDGVHEWHGVHSIPWMQKHLR